MVIVDTSVWISHFKKGENILTSLLNKGEVALHDFIIGELACGSLNKRGTILSLLQDLHRVDTITIVEYLIFIEKFNLNGKGLGFVDINLLASAKISGYPLYTFDKKLFTTAKELHLNF